MRHVSLPVKITLIGTGIGFVLAGFIVVYYRRHRRRPKKLKDEQLVNLDESTVSERKPTHKRVETLANSCRSSPRGFNSVRHLSFDDTGVYLSSSVESSGQRYMLITWVIVCHRHVRVYKADACFLFQKAAAAPHLLMFTVR